MENYSKGKNVEEPLDKHKIPIPDLPEDFLWMQVRGGSKMRELLSVALNQFEGKKSVVWTGFGPSVGKTISCAEIMKREYDNKLHQITKICYRIVQEYWDPKTPELEQIVVERKLPMIHILLSLLPLNLKELGYQGPGEIVNIRDNERSNEKRKFCMQSRTPTKEFAAMGMGSKKRTKKWSKKTKDGTSKTSKEN
ncbi:hypothetical protein RN001_012088 [Aquatica leii]|uniref:DNA/RNA-binding protein Alba-like domain-containing protein n=1 Tax=Aquatica leii TaxID=1421715 RepID=A0AAN7P5E9_9COLE|nr:hypothetical protein RN001_012088 [Aquatica leii]